MNQRVTSWGTIIAGLIALATAALVGLVQIGGLSIPFRTAGPGAVIVVGVLILLAGGFAVLRSNRSATTDPARTYPTSTSKARTYPTSTHPASTAAPSADSPRGSATDLDLNPATDTHEVATDPHEVASAGSGERPSEDDTSTAGQSSH